MQYVYQTPKPSVQKGDQGGVQHAMKGGGRKQAVKEGGGKSMRGRRDRERWNTELGEGGGGPQARERAGQGDASGPPHYSCCPTEHTPPSLPPSPPPFPQQNTHLDAMNDEQAELQQCWRPGLLSGHRSHLLIYYQLGVPQKLIQVLVHFSLTENAAMGKGLRSTALE